MHPRHSSTLVIAVLFALIFASSASGAAPLPYDPLDVSAAPKVEKIDLTARDEKRGRDVPIRVYLPEGTGEAAVVMFSHGLGGSRENNVYLGGHWASRGYVGVFMQHPGSDDSVWKGKERSGRLAALKGAADFENYRLRVRDVTAVVDRLAEWNKTPGHKLCGRLDLSRLGMSGHSFGAITTQAVSGQTYGRGQLLTDSRIKAAIALSPSAPKLGDPKRAFGSVKIPWMLMTGTKDGGGPIADVDPGARLKVYPALPPGGKYELVLDGAEHLAFSDSVIKIENRKRNPNHHRAIKALSTAFWDAYLRGDAAAKAWLDGSGPASVLEKGDRWQKK